MRRGVGCSVRHSHACAETRLGSILLREGTAAEERDFSAHGGLQLLGGVVRLFLSADALQRVHWLRDKRGQRVQGTERRTAACT